MQGLAIERHGVAFCHPGVYLEQDRVALDEMIFVLQFLKVFDDEEQAGERLHLPLVGLQRLVLVDDLDEAAGHGEELVGGGRRFREEEAEGLQVTSQRET